MGGSRGVIEIAFGRGARVSLHEEVYFNAYCRRSHGRHWCLAQSLQ
jgi:hypothetical protein